MKQFFVTCKLITNRTSRLLTKRSSKIRCNRREEQDEEQLEENLSDKNGLFFGEHPAQDRPPEPESELERE